MDLRTLITVKNVSWASLFINIASIVFGILYLIIPVYTALWDICGAIFLVSLFFDLLTIYFIGVASNKSTQIGNRINLMCYFYPLILSVIMLLMMFGNFFISVSYSNSIFDNLGYYIMVYGGYFGELIFAFLIFFYTIKNLSNEEVWVKVSSGTKSKRKAKRVVKIIMQVFILILMVVGVYLIYSVIVGDRGYIGMFFPELAFGFGIIFFSSTVIFLKTIDRKKRKIIFYPFAILGLIISSVLIMPFTLTPLAIGSAETNFSEAFGSNWREQISPDIEHYFMKTQYSIPQYFLGIRPNDVIVKRDVLYFDGKKSSFAVDENITLFFDAYMPLNNGVGLPGQNSTLIRIHGGSWRSFDKGLSNMMQMNKYFAAQGYIVFDIQYGLNRPSRDADLLTPLNVLGNFTIDDMLRHIGNFTRFLSTNAHLYGANLDSVFVSGGSAGGQLTCATALGIASGNYTSLFSPNLTIKGLIPFYPANQLPLSYGTPELIRPEYLVTVNSPPCLIFQGYQDKLVPWTVSQNMKDTYTTNGKGDCAVIYFPLCGHANDLYFSGHFNMVFLYYMERFMYLYL